MKLTLDNQTDVSIEILVNNEIIIVEPFKQTQVETDDKHITIKRKKIRRSIFIYMNLDYSINMIVLMQHIMII